MFSYCDIIACYARPYWGGGLGACSPGKFLNFTTSEVASSDFSPHTHFGLLVHSITLFMKHFVGKANYKLLTTLRWLFFAGVNV
jgi:hypothetical protein